MRYHDGSHGAPDPDEQEGARAARRAILFEESLRTATAFMAVVFSLSVVTVFPFVPAWVFPAALGGVLLAGPAAVWVRAREMREGEQRSVSALWTSALFGVATIGVIVAALLSLARVAELETALLRLSSILAAVALIAWLRGWRPLHEEPEAGSADAPPEHS